MKSISKLWGAGAAVLALALPHAIAQADTPTDAKAATYPGLLGRTEMAFQAGVFDIRHEAVKPRGPIVAWETNLPIDDGFDYHLNLGFDRATKADFKVQDLQIDNQVVYYYRTKAVSPFLGAGFGYDRASTTVAGVRTPDNHLLYEAATGVEVPVSKMAAVRVGLDFDQSFKKPHARELGYDVSTNLWLGETLGASLGAEIRQGRNGAHDSIVYVAGLHVSLD